MLLRSKLFFQESKREFHRVNWPTRQEIIHYTIVVVGISVSVAAFLGALDFAFGYILMTFVF